MYNLNTPIWQLTVGEFLELQERALQTTVKEEPKKAAPEKRLVYGLTGLAELVGCSRVTAQKIKNSGRIDKAITQVGRKIVINADLAMELLNRKK